MSPLLSVSKSAKYGISQNPQPQVAEEPVEACGVKKEPQKTPRAFPSVR